VIRVQRTMTVRRPAEAVVDYLRDFSRTEQWDPGTVSCVREDDGPPREGARWHNVSQFRGRRTELTYRLTTSQDRRLVFTGENRTAETTDDLTFRTVDGGTEVTYRATIRFKGLAALAGPFLRKEFERLGDEIVRTLPRAVEHP
jgi:carbon monoxide dehydrogenase subunit G